MVLEIRSLQYNIPHPPRKLKHKKLNIFEYFIYWIVRVTGTGHYCQICGDVDPNGWLQIDHQVYKDSQGCSVVCMDCAEKNPDVFSMDNAV